MNKYSVILSDDLLKMYYSFKQGNQCDDQNLLESFFSCYQAPFLTNVEQLKRIGYDEKLFPQLFQQLSAQGLVCQTLEDLAKLTVYKLILNSNYSQFPYVNVLQDKVVNNYSLSFKIGENRDKVKEIIKALCEDAKFILIYDKYFCNNWRYTEDFFHSIVPKKELTILHDQHLLAKTSEIKFIFNNWKIKQDQKNTLKNSHDRYLLIDNSIEIILSSGFLYLFSEDKDLTCVIRKK